MLLWTVLLFVLGTPASHATTAGVLPQGSSVVYAGGALNTFSERATVSDGETVVRVVDRAMRYRLDTYFAAGFADRWMASASIPLVHSTVIDDAARAPCGTVSIDGYCDPITTVGGTRFEVRYALVRSPFALSPFLAIGAEPWNKSVRWRYTAMGDGTVDLMPGLYAGKDLQAGPVGLDVYGWGAYAWRFGWLVEGGPAGTFRAPGDDVRGGIGVRVQPPGRVSVEVGADGMQRLWGLDWDSGYQAAYFPTDDRWTVLYYSHIAASAKVSVALPGDMGVHVGVNRVIACANGPTDTTDISIGVHRYRAPKGR